MECLMDTKIRIGKAISYTTTDGKVFAGKGSKKAAEKYQRSLNKKDLLDEFDTFMRKIFGIKCEYTRQLYPGEEQEFCDNMMKEVPIYAEDGNFKAEISEFILDLFGFIGQEKWQQIHDFLTKKI